MKRKNLIPSGDIYTYHQQALDMLDVEHPHYKEIETHLLAQIRDELSDRYNTRPDHGTAPARAITNQSGSETAA